MASNIIIELLNRIRIWQSQRPCAENAKPESSGSDRSGAPAVIGGEQGVVAGFSGLSNSKGDKI